MVRGLAISGETVPQKFNPFDLVWPQYRANRIRDDKIPDGIWKNIWLLGGLGSRRRHRRCCCYGSPWRCSLCLCNPDSRSKFNGGGSATVTDSRRGSPGTQTRPLEARKRAAHFAAGQQQRRGRGGRDAVLVVVVVVVIALIAIGVGRIHTLGLFVGCKRQRLRGRLSRRSRQRSLDANHVLANDATSTAAATDGVAASIETNTTAAAAAAFFVPVRARFRSDAVDTRSDAAPANNTSIENVSIRCCHSVSIILQSNATVIATIVATIILAADVVVATQYFHLVGTDRNRLVDRECVRTTRASGGIVVIAIIAAPSAAATSTKTSVKDNRLGIGGPQGDRNGRGCRSRGAFSFEKREVSVELGNSLGFVDLVFSFVVQDRILVGIGGHFADHAASADRSVLPIAAGVWVRIWICRFLHFRCCGPVPYGAVRFGLMRPVRARVRVRSYLVSEILTNPRVICVCVCCVHRTTMQV